MQVHTLAPASAENLILMGAVYYNLGEYQRSIHCNDLCIVVNPSIAEAYANIATSLQQLGHLSTAVLYYQVCSRRPLTWCMSVRPCRLRGRQMLCRLSVSSLMSLARVAACLPITSSQQHSPTFS